MRLVKCAAAMLRQPGGAQQKASCALITTHARTKHSMYQHEQVALKGRVAPAPAADACSLLQAPVLAAPGSVLTWNSTPLYQSDMHRTEV